MTIKETDIQIIKDWHPTKNGDIDPLTLTTGSVYNAWWLCSVCGYEWQTYINHKYRGDRCPACSGRVVFQGFNDLMSRRPDLAAEWDEKLNNTTPDNVYYRKSEVFNWVCKLGHKYAANLNHRINGTGCPYCKSKRILKGFNDLKSRYPEISEDWDYDKNTETPEKILFGSGKKVYWKCKTCGFEWKTSVANRTVSKTGCPKCNAQRAGQKNTENAVQNNNFYSNYPDIASEWDYERNYPVNPENIPAKTNKRFGWICSKCGYSWVASVNSRTAGSGCPACANKVVVKGKNDLKSLFPEVAKEWNYEKNNGVMPDQVVAGSNKKFWWKCSICGREWEKDVGSRTYGGKGCKICGAEKSVKTRLLVRARKNNLAENYPDIAAEWDYEKNEGKKPSDFSSKSNQKAYWKCSFCGNEWLAPINSRTSSKSTCPNCTYVGTSFPEQAIYFYIKKKFQDAKSRYTIFGSEFDIYIPSANTAIEYDGIYYHKKSIDKDNKKDKICKDNGIRLIRFRDPLLSDTESSLRITLKDGSIKQLNRAITELLEIFECDNFNINIEEDQIKILSSYKHEVEENSLGKLFPDLVKEWDPDLNGKLTPYNITPSSNIKANWICSKCGNKWKAQVSDRTRKDGSTGCPYCNNKRIIPGFNDLQMKNPVVAKEWHPTKNNSLLPSEISSGSNRKVWWLCSKCGHEWQTTPATRTVQGCGCAVCAGKEVKIGFNDLATTEPDLSLQWNYEKNNGLTPQMITRGSSKKVWWKCSKGHEWQSTVKNRTIGRGCPVCAEIRRRSKKEIEGQIKFD